MSSTKSCTPKSNCRQTKAKTTAPQELPVHISEVAARVSARLLAQNDDPNHRLPSPDLSHISPEARFLYYYIIARLRP
jgi:hypothetical protein